RAELLEVLAPITPQASTVPFFSTVTGQWLDTSGMDADYWYRSLRQSVEFAPAIDSLLGEQYRVFVEVSPHPVLTMALVDAVDEIGARAVVSGTLRRDQGGLDRFLTSLAELFVRGVAVDWSTILAGGGRVELPTYAFQHEHFWLTPAEVEVGTGTDPEDAAFWSAVDDQDLESLTSSLNVDETSLAAVLPALSSWRRQRREHSAVDPWRYGVSWTPLSKSLEAKLSGTWLLVRAQGIGDASVESVSSALSGHGAQVLELVLDETCVDREVLAARLQGLEGVSDVAGIVSVLAAAEQPSESFPALASGLALSLALVQALGDLEIEAPLWFLTQGATSTGRSDRVANPVQAQVLGMGLTVALEHPQRWGGVVDLPQSLDQRAAKRLAGVLAGSTGEDQLAIRSSGILARRIVHAPSGKRASRTWTPRGTTLITGGTGTLARHLARWLAGQGAEHVVLTSRRGDQAPGAAELVAELAELGAQATVVSCDVTDRDAVAGLLAQLKEDGHQLRNVMHTAAVIELKSLEETTTEEFARVVHAKVAGARHLDELLVEDLDSFILYSSVSGMWGSGQHGAYVAGNAYLAALADNRRGRGLRAMSLSWGIWADDLSLGRVDPEQIRRSGLVFMEPDLALLGLKRALDEDETVLGLADIDWERYHSVFTSSRPTRLFDELPEVRKLTEVATQGTGATDTDLAAGLGSVPAAEQQRVLLELVRSTAASVLGHASSDALSEEAAFRDVGFDSVTAVDLRNRLATATGLTLPTTMVFDYPNPLALMGFLHAQIAGTQIQAAAPTASESGDDEPIAIIGMGCRLPGSISSPEQLWDLVVAGGDAVSGFPTDRGWDADALYDADPDMPGKTYSTRGGFLHDVAEFDAGFFGISPREAVSMDPQQRLLLETSWEAFERAGIDPATLRGTLTGTFIGASYQDYRVLAANGDQSAEAHMITGALPSMMSGRLSYLFGLQGPAVTMDTACSSSLVALHLACQSLRNRESNLSLAGGASMMATPTPFIGFSRQRAIAADGRCKAYSESADGFGLGEGVGVVLLERLSDALRNGHRVLAVVRGSAINQDGASNGLTAPNGPAQQRVIRQALVNARVSANEVDVVEGHGTGTSLGDPIEAQALLATYGQDRECPLLLGSLKSNIGHVQMASGVASVIKMVMALQHGVVPATLYVSEPSTHVDWDSGAIELVTETTQWPETGHPRRAGVSSFGFSGTNVHAVLEQAPPSDVVGVVVAPDDTAGDDAVDDATDVAAAPPMIVPLVLSAKTDEALRAQATGLLSLVAKQPDVPLTDLAFSLATSRSAFDRRAAVVAKDHTELATALVALRDGLPSSNLVQGRVGRGRLAFLFAGQGSQRAGAGRGLYEHFPVFADALDAVLAHFDS
ncbi:MAG: pimaricinolide synthase PimS2, partial [Actinomycetota bacterium]|nr:pimaricinolide synthase PimS2 [Actinomycetota bacterium]